METRFHMLRPAEAAARRQECPIAYIPLGIVEWHGVHNPLGADGIQAEELALRCSQRGGVAFPTLYYGDIRPYSIMEGNAGETEYICKAMKMDIDKQKAEFVPYSEEEQFNFHKELLIKMLYQAEAYGFEAAVFICGHYPLIETALPAVEEYNRVVKKTRPDSGLLAMACLDFEMVDRNVFPKAGDHAAGWETSHLLAVCPDRVDMTIAPAPDTNGVGVYGQIPARDANASLGNSSFDSACDGIVERAKYILENRAEFLSKVQD